MTREHFKALALALHETMPNCDKMYIHNQWLLDVITIARICRQFDPHFDFDEFIWTTGKGDQNENKPNKV